MMIKLTASLLGKKRSASSSSLHQPSEKRSKAISCAVYDDIEDEEPRASLEEMYENAVQQSTNQGKLNGKVPKTINKLLAKIPVPERPLAEAVQAYNKGKITHPTSALGGNGAGYIVRPSAPSFVSSSSSHSAGGENKLADYLCGRSDDSSVRDNYVAAPTNKGATFVGSLLVDSSRLNRNSQSVSVVTSSSSSKVSSSLVRYARPTLVSGKGQAATGIDVVKKFVSTSAVLSLPHTRLNPAFYHQRTQQSRSSSSSPSAKTFGTSGVIGITDDDKDKRKKASKLSTEIDDLLSRKSVNADQAENEWFANYSKRLDKLAYREVKLQEEANIVSMTVKAYQCNECRLTTENEGILCRRKGHTLLVVRVVKRFFECTQCLRRDFTLGRPAYALPLQKCSCGAYDWRVCGKRGTGEDNKALVERMVPAASEWASRKDKELIRVMAEGIN